MSRVTALKETVFALGCFPLDKPGQRKSVFFQQAIDFLTARQPVGIFPEDPWVTRNCLGASWTRPLSKPRNEVIANVS